MALDRTATPNERGVAPDTASERRHREAHEAANAVSAVFPRRGTPGRDTASHAGHLDGILDLLVDEIADRLAVRLEAGGLARAHVSGDGNGEAWRLLSVDETAAVLGRSSRWVHDAVRTRGLPHVHLDGGGKMFDPRDLEAWARGRRVPAVGS